MLYIALWVCYLHHHTCSSSSLLHHPQLNGEISKPEVEVTRRIEKYWTNERKWEREEEKLMGKGPHEPSSHLRIYCTGASGWIGQCLPVLLILWRQLLGDALCSLVEELLFSTSLTLCQYIPSPSLQHSCWNNGEGIVPDSGRPFTLCRHIHGQWKASSDSCLQNGCLEVADIVLRILLKYSWFAMLY